MHEKWINRLKSYKRGDLIERMDILEYLEPFCEKMISRNVSSSSYFFLLGFVCEGRKREEIFAIF